MYKPLFIKPKDIACIERVSYNTGWRRYSTIFDALGKRPGQRLSIHEYSQYENIPLDHIYQLLNTTRADKIPA